MGPAGLLPTSVCSARWGHHESYCARVRDVQNCFPAILVEPETDMDVGNAGSAGARAGQPRDYESPALTVVLQAHVNQQTNEAGREV